MITKTCVYCKKDISCGHIFEQPTGEWVCLECVMTWVTGHDVRDKKC